MPSNYLIQLLLPPSIFPSIRVFSNESALLIRWPKCWSFSFSISPSNEHSGLISFRMDWLDLLEVQGTLKSLLQHHSSKASILWLSAFFIVQLSHPCLTIIFRGEYLSKLFGIFLHWRFGYPNSYILNNLLNYFWYEYICYQYGYHTLHYNPKLWCLFWFLNCSRFIHLLLDILVASSFEQLRTKML